MRSYKQALFGTLCILLLYSHPVLSIEPQILIGKVNADNINVRADATASSKIICTLSYNDTIEVIGEAYGWYRIRLPKHTNAFIRKDLVITINNKTARVAKERANIRLGANENAIILGKASKDEQLNIIEDLGDWYRIEPPKDTFGWTHKKFIQIKEDK